MALSNCRWHCPRCGRVARGRDGGARNLLTVYDFDNFAIINDLTDRNLNHDSGGHRYRDSVTAPGSPSTADIGTIDQQSTATNKHQPRH